MQWLNEEWVYCWPYKQPEVRKRNTSCCTQPLAHESRLSGITFVKVWRVSLICIERENELSKESILVSPNRLWFDKRRVRSSKWPLHSLLRQELPKRSVAGAIKPLNNPQFPNSKPDSLAT
jgi:hypothetical protein